MLPNNKVRKRKACTSITLFISIYISKTKQITRQKFNQVL